MAIYGPYYRHDPEEVIKSQLANKQIWGGKPRNYLRSDIPKVKAYTKWMWGQGTSGIEFFTDVLPDKGSVPGSPVWSGAREGVVNENGFAKIRVVDISRYSEG